MLTLNHEIMAPFHPGNRVYTRPNPHGPFPLPNMRPHSRPLAQVGGNPVAVANAIITGVKAVDMAGRIIKPGTRIENALDKKYEGKNMPGFLKGVKKVAHWTKEHFGWGPDGTKISGAESEKALEAAIKTAWQSAGKTFAEAKKAGALAWKASKASHPPAKSLAEAGAQMAQFALSKAAKPKAGAGAKRRAPRKK